MICKIKYIIFKLPFIFLFLCLINFNCIYFAKNQLLYKGERLSENQVARIINPIKGVEVISSFKLSKVAIRIIRIDLQKIGSRVETIDILPGEHTIICEIIAVSEKGWMIEPVKADGFFKIVYDFQPGFTYKPMYEGYGISYHSYFINSQNIHEETDSEYTISLVNVNDSSIVATGKFIRF